MASYFWIPYNFYGMRKCWKTSKPNVLKLCFLSYFASRLKPFFITHFAPNPHLYSYVTITSTAVTDNLPC